MSFKVRLEFSEDFIDELFPALKREVDAFYEQLGKTEFSDSHKRMDKYAFNHLWNAYSRGETKKYEDAIDEESDKCAFVSWLLPIAEYNYHKVMRLCYINELLERDTLVELITAEALIHTDRMFVSVG